VVIALQVFAVCRKLYLV